ncbi:unnamed protein product, partial [Tuber aestivum]
YNHNGLQNHQAQTNLYSRLSCFFIALIPKANEAIVEKTQGITKSRNLFSDSPILDANSLFIGRGTSAAPKGRELRALVAGKVIARYLGSPSALDLDPAQETSIGREWYNLQWCYRRIATEALKKKR